MRLTPASLQLPFDVILTCADRPAEQTNMGQLQKEVAGKGTCYTLMKKQFHVPQCETGHESSCTASWRTTKVKPGAGSIFSSAPASVVDSASRDSFLLHVVLCLAELARSQKWVQSGISSSSPPDVSWASVSISSAAQQGGGTDYVRLFYPPATCRCKMSTPSHIRAWGGFCWWKEFKLHSNEVPGGGS